MFLLILLVLVAGLSYTVYSKNARKPIQQGPADHNLQEQYRLFREEIRHTSHYYQLLGQQERDLFVKRSWAFFKLKRFEARGIPHVSFRMRTIISAYAAQLTFGLPDIRLEQFRTIIVYPQPYRSTIMNQMHKGEANPNGAIIFSWKDLADGHNEATNGVNLALHELAHALRIENISVNNEFNFLDQTALRRFDQLAESEMARMKAFTNDHFLRSYGATNGQEFFAVCVENFFERPLLFSEALPELYRMMTQILQQDPLVRPIRINA